MAQENIDFGAFPNDPDADAIRVAFQKVQNNFSELFTSSLTTGVDQVFAGSGVLVDQNTGNVTVTAKIPQITIQTGDSLKIGVGTATTNTATITSGSTPFVVTLANTINTVNIVATGNLVGTLAANSSSQPNITSVGTLSALSVSGNVNAQNFIGNLIATTVTATNLGSPGANTQVLYNYQGNLRATSGLTFDGANLTAANRIQSGNLSVTGNANINTVNATYLYGDGSNLTNVSVGSGGSYTTANLIATGNLVGTLAANASSQPNITSVGVLESLSVTGTSNLANVNAGNISATGNANVGILRATYLYGDGSNLTNLGTPTSFGAGNISVSGNLTGRLSADSALQPNITTVGTLTNLSVSGAIATPAITAGNISVTGNISAPGANTQIVFNNQGNLGGTANLVFTGSNLNVAANLNATGNLTGNSVTLSGNIRATGNLSTGGNIITASNLTVSGNTAITGSTTIGGNVGVTGKITVGAISSIGNIDSGGNLNANSVTLSGEANANVVRAVYLYGDGSNISNVGTVVPRNEITRASSYVSIDSYGIIHAGDSVNGDQFKINGAGGLEVYNALSLTDGTAYYYFTTPTSTQYFLGQGLEGSQFVAFCQDGVAPQFTIDAPAGGQGNTSVSLNGSNIIIASTDLSNSVLSSINLSNSTISVVGNMVMSSSPASSTNNTQVATTAFVQTVVGAKANLTSPAFSGVPTAPTAANGTNTTQIATTQFVANAIAAGAGAGGGSNIANGNANINTYSNGVISLNGTTFNVNSAINANGGSFVFSTGTGNTFTIGGGGYYTFNGARIYANADLYVQQRVFGGGNFSIFQNGTATATKFQANTFNYLQLVGSLGSTTLADFSQGVIPSYDWVNRSITKSANSYQGNVSTVLNAGNVNLQKAVTSSLSTRGSISFDGSGTNYVSVVASTDWSANSSYDFTAEGWFYYQSGGSTNTTLFMIGGPSPAFQAGIQFVGGNIVMIISGSAFTVSTGTVPATNTWTHFALVKYAGVWSVYKNGVLQGTPYGSPSGSYNGVPNGPVYIGIDNNNATPANTYFAGRMTNFRIVCGSGAAVYKENFTPPTTELTAIAGTALLLLTQTSLTAYTDSSGTNKFPTYNGTVWNNDSPIVNNIVRVSLTAPTSSGNYTLALPTTSGANGQLLSTDGTGNLNWIAGFGNSVTSNNFILNGIGASVAGGTGSITCTKAASTNLSYANMYYPVVLGAQDFTFEGWFKYTAIDTTNGTLFGIGGGSTDILVKINPSNQLIANVFTSTGIVLGTAPPTNTWFHIAVSKNQGVIRIFLNGTVLYTNSSFSTTSLGSDMQLGKTPYATGTYLDCNITNVRFVTLTGLYVNNFTPSTSALTAVTGTTLLLLTQTSGTVNYDNSGNYKFNNMFESGFGYSADTPITPPTNQITITSPTPLPASYTLKLPANVGTSGQVLSTDGAGNLSWVTGSGGGGGGTGNSITNGINASITAGSVSGAGYIKTTMSNVDVITTTSLATTFSSNVSLAGNVTVSGNTIHTGKTTLGSNANVIITGGSTGQMLTTDGAGNLSWTTPAGGGGSGTSISNGNSIVATYNSTGQVVISTGLLQSVFSNTGVGIGNVAVNASGYTSLTIGSNTNGGRLDLVKNGTQIGALYSSGANLLDVEAIGATTLRFNTNGFERIRVGTDGNVGIGTNGNASAKLQVVGDVSVSGGNTTLGSNANVKISGGTIGQVLATDGAGNLSWVASSTGAPGTTPTGAIVAWSGSVTNVPTGWVLCDGTNGTPDLRNRFIVGAGSTYQVGQAGGSPDSIVVAHTHSVVDPGHNHVMSGVNATSTAGPLGAMAYSPGDSRNATSSNVTNISISSTGTTGIGQNLPPYYALCYIMCISGNSPTFGYGVSNGTSVITTYSTGNVTIATGLSNTVYSNTGINLTAGNFTVQNGNVGIGTLTPSVKLAVIGAITATESITAYYSDENLKTKLGTIENALDKVSSLEGFYYEANETAQSLGYKVKREVGVSAQQVQKILPEVVVPAPIDDKYLTVHYDRLVPLLIEAIKELRAEIEELKRK